MSHHVLKKGAPIVLQKTPAFTYGRLQSIEGRLVGSSSLRGFSFVSQVVALLRWSLQSAMEIRKKPWVSSKNIKKPSLSQRTRFHSVTTMRSRQDR